MRTIPLRSRNGCLKCRERRRKCDEQQPVCGECLRLGFKCHRLATSSHLDARPTTARRAKSSPNSVCITEMQPRTTENRVPAIVKHGDRLFDHPAVLRASATSVIDTTDGKHILKHLFEQGHVVLRYPAERLPVAANLNSFSIGYAMAVGAPVPVHLQALLCVGAAFLSRKNSKYEKLALEYYNVAMSAFRSALQRSSGEPPAEWTCAVAALLSYYQVSMPQSLTVQYGAF